MAAEQQVHHTLLELLPGLGNVEKALAHSMGKPWVGEGEVHLTHVLMTLVVLGVALGLAWRAGLARIPAQDRVYPEDKPGLRTAFEMLVEAVLGMAEEIAGPVYARRFLPLVGTLAIFIFLSNALGLIPGFTPPTDSINTTAACALPVFFATHYFGVKAHGLKNYLKHFAGPVLFLAPLMVPIEIISHLARPLSLTLRLFGNIMGDHMVLAVFVGIFPLLVPVPVLVLGTVVAIVQTLVFCMLSLVYLGLAVAHDESH